MCHALSGAKLSGAKLSGVVCLHSSGYFFYKKLHFDAATFQTWSLISDTLFIEVSEPRGDKSCPHPCLGVNSPPTIDLRVLIVQGCSFTF